MCGLAGVLDPRGTGAERLEEIAVALGTALRHRGPDGHGVWSDAAAGVALAHRRLSIIDVSEQGSQPMVSADGRYVLVFNGEIYNHPELAQRLRGDGVRLRGHSDTEVLLETIARRSLAEALGDANGMFALALWDRRERRLTLARDRLGEKPLYYGWVGGRFVFASEVRSLVLAPGFEGRLDAGALALLLRHSYIPAPHTVYEGVHKLLPGHLLDVTSAGSGEPRPFWTLAQAATAGRAHLLDETDEALVERAESLLQDSVRMRMVSDVPLGAFLSGGVDSSLVVALMQSVADQPVRTFSVAVGGQYDESQHAAAVAAHLGTRHTELRLSETEALTQAVRVPALYDEPFADPSALPTALVCAAAREHVTVCLTGDGGDEVMAGYNRYLAADRALSRVGRLPAGVRSGVAGAIRSVPPQQWDRMGALLPARRRPPDLGTKLHKLSGVLGSADTLGAYRSLTTVLDPAVLLPGVREPATAATDPSGRPAGLDPLHLMLFLDGVMTLPDDMLVKVDRASMAVSLECRVPLLDHRFVELAWSLPARAKVRDRQGKWLLRQVLHRHVPRELLDRPKQGFDPPVAGWLRGPLRDWVGDLLSPERLRRQGLLDPAAVATLTAEHMSGRRNHDYPLWTLLMLEGWLEGERVVAPA
ncbi:asparagine synthase (glutamine-hydrolyzing) [Nocardioides mesophilus]|uniref:asparagine synthase (glutamine-hydrolyzing) n=1 Tax=Nocardioides mesophilus TaxID=433659 RepID=A0A7G9R9B1_9ACTN|nr:asparagine synthase (glutamine-hydrolyzing) [Nocardioides mesophilus]QNN52186.1 asparagine synthase (glutamine-hydrolyzing) [Nocardioides mesophilus]